MRFIVLILSVLLLSCSQLKTDESYSKEEFENLHINLYAGKTDLDLYSRPIQDAHFYKLAIEKEPEMPLSSCEIYQDLASSNFILKEYALTRSYRVCPYTIDEIIEFYFSLKLKSHRILLLDFLLTATKKLNHPSYEYLLYETVLLENESEAKEKILLNLISLNTNLKKMYTSKLHELSPRYVSNYNNENILKVANDFRKHQDFQNARNLYSKIFINIELSLSEREDSYQKFCHTHKLQKNDLLFLNCLKNYLAFFKSHQERMVDEYSKTEILYARTLWTQQNWDQAYQTLNQYLKLNARSDDFKANVLWLLGAMNEEKKKWAKAIEFYRQAINLKFTDEELQEKIIWKIVFNTFRAKDYQLTINEINSYLTSLKLNDAFLLKLKFFAGYSHFKLDKLIEAKNIWNELIELDPFNYYSLLSQIILNPNLSRISIERYKDQVHYPQLKWAYYTEDKKVIEYLADEIKSIDKSSLYLMNDYFLIGKYREAMQLATILHSRQIEAKNKLRFIPYLYPNAYSELTTSFTNEFKLPPFLSTAIIRQESAFDPLARSGADAFGLMQIIPSRAMLLSKSRNKTYSNYSDLYKPNYNLELGHFYLLELNNQFNNVLPFAIGSYNAGSEPVIRWKKERYFGDIIEYIESVPYFETQKYIKLVLRNFIIYNLLYSKEEKINFSKWIQIP